MRTKPRTRFDAYLNEDERAILDRLTENLHASSRNMALRAAIYIAAAAYDNAADESLPNAIRDLLAGQIQRATIMAI